MFVVSTLLSITTMQARYLYSVMCIQHLLAPVHKQYVLPFVVLPFSVLMIQLGVTFPPCGNVGNMVVMLFFVFPSLILFTECLPFPDQVQLICSIRCNTSSLLDVANIVVVM